MNKLLIKLIQNEIICSDYHSYCFGKLLCLPGYFDKLTDQDVVNFYLITDCQLARQVVQNCGGLLGLQCCDPLTCIYPGGSFVPNFPDEGGICTGIYNVRFSKLIIIIRLELRLSRIRTIMHVTRGLPVL